MILTKYMSCNDIIPSVKYKAKQEAKLRVDYRKECFLCGKSLRGKHIKEHIMSVHFKIRRFHCPSCEYGAYKKNDLTRHQIRHRH